MKIARYNNHTKIVEYQDEANVVLPTSNKPLIDYYKQLLANTDYQAIKYAEGFISEEEYTPIKLQRQEWRNKINELEEE